MRNQANALTKQSFNGSRLETRLQKAAHPRRPRVKKAKRIVKSAPWQVEF